MRIAETVFGDATDSAMRILGRLAWNVAILALIVFALDMAIGRTLRHFYFFESSGQHRRTTYAMEQTEAELIVFGSSRASRHYVPEVFCRELNLTCYNTGMEGNGIFYQLAVLRSILRRYSPEVVVLDFDGIRRGSGSHHSYDSLSSLLPYYRTHEEIRDIIEMRGPLERLKLCSEIYPFNSELFSIAMGNLEINKRRHLDDRGYAPLKGAWTMERQTSEEPAREFDFERIAFYNEFIDRCTRAGTTVFLVCSPSFQVPVGRGPGEDLRELRHGPMVHSFDFSKDERFNDGHLFNDPGHLNHDGALMYSKIVATEIKDELEME